MMDIAELQKRIQYHFRDETLLIRALTHSSYYNEHKHTLSGDNERLEFLGDAVLELVSSEYLYITCPKLPEGELTKRRASKVCEPTLALCARKFSLEQAVLLGKGEELTGGRERDSIISDAMEALIGAVYLDGGFANAKDFVRKYVLLPMEERQVFCDSKTILQEVSQEYAGCDPVYELVKEEGPEHNRTFYVHALIGETVWGQGMGKTKKAAQQQAAAQAVEKLQKELDKRQIP